MSQVVTENRNRSFTFHLIIHLPFAPACPPSNWVVTEAQTTISPYTKVMILFLSVANTRSLFLNQKLFRYLKANTFNQIHEIFSSCSFIDGQVQDMLPSTPFVYVKVLNCTGAFPCLKNRSAFFEEKQRQALQHGQSSKA